MMRQFKLFFLTCFILPSTALLLAQGSDRTLSPTEMQAAEAAFPQDLRYAGNPPSENLYNTCAVVFSRNADGTPDLLAAAYSGDGAKVAILANSPNSARIVSGITNQLLPTDGVCNLQIVDLADPGHPDSPSSSNVTPCSFQGPKHSFLITEFRQR